MYLNQPFQEQSCSYFTLIPNTKSIQPYLEASRHTNTFNGQGILSSLFSNTLRIQILSLLVVSCEVIVSNKLRKQYPNIYSLPWLLILSVCFSVNLVILCKVRKFWAKLSAEHKRMGDFNDVCIVFGDSSHFSFTESFQFDVNTTGRCLLTANVKRRQSQFYCQRPYE